MNKMLSTGSRSYTPHDYQKRGIKMLIQQACAGLFLDPGLGKTSISLAAMKLLLAKPVIKGVLVIAPLRAVYNVWPGEVEKWTDFKDMSYTIIHGVEDERLEMLWGEQTDLYFINPEGIPWLAQQLAKTPRDKWPFDVLIVDESTKFKNATSKRFKALRGLIPKFRRRYILTGTPTPNGLMDLFGQIYILDEGTALGRYITHYRNNYFYSSGFGGYTWTPRLSAMEEITAKIHPLVLRMRHEDYLTLPPLVNQYTWLTLPKEARDLYKGIEDNFIATVGDDVVIAPNAAAAGIKCRQVLNGALYINEAHDWQLIHDVKLEAIQDLVEELSGQPLLIFYEFNHDRERLQEALKWPAIGQQSAKKDSELMNLFNAGALPGLIAHPASAGHGLNLQGACAHVAWFGLTWNLEHYDQAIRRVWRQGNEAQRVVVHHFCITDSLDKVVVQTLGQKDRTQTSFMEQVRAYNRS
jgi:SNF2 family DNA or RNA helicase